ncbi:hypothetical protein [Natrarchaeobaculum sulfurireducens]|uniref:hypothetical protein n=1 Tax=Natrarchaeobaculum sulfurireducens TaxID=2044521 RepID=UPI000E3CA474|nr:hypothetical protein [Natrarchaeobaculum sulfurireducens]
MDMKNIGWRDPKEAMVIMGKILAALVGAILFTGVLREFLPYSAYSAGSPERVLIVGAFYTAWMLLTFKFIFGKFIPLKVKRGETPVVSWSGK